MAEEINNQNTQRADEISLKELIIKIGNRWYYLKTQWLKIAIIGFIGGVFGFVNAWLNPILYTAKLTFVVEEAKSGTSGLGSLASLAGQFGVDVGTSSGGGLLSGDNVILYFKSESLAREVLLSKYDSSSKQSVADLYADVYGLKNKWQNNKKIGVINFLPSTPNQIYTRTQDSLIKTIIQQILKSQFSVTKTDKKAALIEVSAIMENELLSKIYCERIVKVAIDRYINVKTQRQKNTVDKLQSRVDSVAFLLSKKTLTGASLQTSATTMDINPLYKTATSVAVETTGRDKTMLATIFASVVQNLELAKFTLSQETPVIQIVDSPTFPLKIEKKSKLLAAIAFSIVFALIFVFYLVVKKMVLSALK